MARIICLIAGYCFGLIQSGYIFGKTRNMDIRKFGSGNAGATNTLRVLGARAGFMVFLGDFLKAFIPCMAVRIIFEGDFKYLLLLYTGLGVVLGHNFPFYLGFKGGKGVASTAGILVALDLRITGLCLVAFVLTVIITRFVSLASIFVMLILIGAGFIFSGRGDYGLSAAAINEFRLLCLIIGGLSIYRHRSNIMRLLRGEENRISFKSGKKED